MSTDEIPKEGIREQIKNKEYTYSPSTYTLEDFEKLTEIRDSKPEKLEPVEFIAFTEEGAEQIQKALKDYVEHHYKPKNK